MSPIKVIKIAYITRYVCESESVSVSKSGHKM